MTTAEEFAKRSITEKITGKDIEAAGGQWQSTPPSYTFKDGSRCAFNTSKPAFKIDAGGWRSFSHYELEIL